MKKILMVLTLGLLFTLMPALAQDHRGGGRGIERLKTALSLTDQQVAQLQPLFQEQMAQHKAQFEAMKTQMDSVLTPEQKARFEAMKAEWKSKRGEGRQAGPGGGHHRGEFAEKLGLTQEQKDKLQAMREQMKTQMASERQAFQSKLAQVLTPEQQAKWEQLKQNHHRGGRGKPAQG